MAYVPKAGSFSLFKNDRKTEEKQPDYRGDGLDLTGAPVWVSAWVRESAKGKFFSCLITQKTSPVAMGEAPRPTTARTLPDLGDDIPF